MWFFFVWWWAIPELCFFSSLFWGVVLGVFWRQKTQRSNLKPHQFFPLVFLPFSKNEARTFFPFCQTACVCSAALWTCIHPDPDFCLNKKHICSCRWHWNNPLEMFWVATSCNQKLFGDRSCEKWPLLGSILRMAAWQDRGLTVLIRFDCCFNENFYLFI